MTAQERMERVLKDLDVLTRIAEKAAHGAVLLDDKVSMHRLCKDLREARQIARKNHFAIEDADRYAAGVIDCPTCGGIVSESMIG